MNKYNRMNVDNQFVARFKSNVEAIPYITVLILIFSFILPFLGMLGILILVAIISLIIIYYLYLTLLAFSEMLVHQNNILARITEISDNINKSQDKNDNHQETIDELPEI